MHHKLMQSLWKTVWQLLKALNIKLSYDPAMPLPSIIPGELKRYIHAKTCTQIFIAGLSMTAKKWKQSKWLSIENKQNVVQSYDGRLSCHKRE